MKQILTLLLAFFPSIVYAELDKIYESTVIIVIGDNELDPATRPSGGTGTFVAEDEDKYYIITAGHVVDQANGVCKVATHRDGKESKLVPAKVEWLKYANDVNVKYMIDAAIVSVLKSDWKEAPPVLVSVFKEKVYTKDMSVDSSGYPAPWPTAFRGYIKDVAEHGFWVNPGAKPGRSGSGVINAATNHFMGIIVLNTGYSVGNNQIYKLLLEDSKTELIGKIFK